MRPNRERGVFETLAVLAGRPVELDAHLARLGASLEALFPGRSPLRDLAAEIEARAETIGRGGLRVTVAPGAEDELEAKVAATEIDAERVLPETPPEVGSRSVVVAGGLGGHKWADRRLLDAAQAALDSDSVPLLFDWDGALLEASRGNAFAVIDGILLTPPTDGRILPGVSRARALEVAAASGFEAREVTLRREDLFTADEVFLTGSLRGVELVRELDGAELRSNGEIAAHIAAELRRAWAHGGLDRVPRR